MAHDEIATAYELLRALEADYQQRSAGLPQQRAIKKPWTGIGFRIAETNLVAAVDDVREILHFPRLTAIPGTKSWVRGMANVRGTLVPIIDLKQYLGHPPVEIHARTRVLVVHHDDLWVGLMVDSIAGLKHFHEDHARALAGELSPALTGYLKGAYAAPAPGSNEELNWYVFSFKELVGNPEFARIAA
jgi:twitching motility protein PilI